MDPLSVAASVVGLISAGAQLVPMFYNLGSAIKDAPHHAQVAVSELGDITILLIQLQKYIDGRAQASIQRLNLITVEHITASLTDCVITFSELDAVLKSMHVDQGLKAWDRAMWFMKKDEVGSLISRLQNHKSSFTLMLNIIQCATLSEAERNMDRLCDVVNEVLQSNKRLSQRLRNIENAVTTQNLRPPSPTRTGFQSSSGYDNRADPDQDHRSEHAVSGADFTSFTDTVQASAASLEETDELDPQTSHFEDLLHKSHVYQHAGKRGNQIPVGHDKRATLALSICSCLSLGEVSTISVYALPVYARDLSNPQCYAFGNWSTFHESLAPPSSDSIIQLGKSSKDVAVFKGDLDQVRLRWRKEISTADHEPGTRMKKIHPQLGMSHFPAEEREERTEPIGEGEEVEWDGLRRRKTLRASDDEPVTRRKTIHPPLGTSHFLDYGSMSDSDSKPRPPFFFRRQQFNFSKIPSETEETRAGLADDYNASAARYQEKATMSGPDSKSYPLNWTLDFDVITMNKLAALRASEALASKPTLYGWE